MLPSLQLGRFPNSKLAMTIKAVFFDAAGTLFYMFTYQPKPATDEMD